MISRFEEMHNTAFKSHFSLYPKLMKHFKKISVLFLSSIFSMSVFAQSEISTVNILEKNPKAITHDVEFSAPVYIGGQQALEKYIRDNLNYPKLAIKQGLEGTVHVLFKITEQGKIQDPVIKSSCKAILDEAAIELIQSMPNWHPALQGGKAQEAYYQLPITFQLQ